MTVGDFDAQPYARDVNERLSEALISHYQGYTVNNMTIRDVHVVHATSHTIAGEAE